MLVKNFKIKRNGFTLIELVLVVSIGLAMSFLAFNTMVKNQEADMANSVGEQMKTLGNAVNNYIVNHYDSLSSLKDSQHTQTDIGPRNCNTGNSTCTITTDTLKAEGSIISGKPIQGHNGAGDAFSIGGWDGNDYEFHLGTTKPLTIWHNGGASNEKRLQVWGLQENTGNLVVKGANDGLSSGEITASGNITTQSKLIGKTLSLNQMVALGNTCSTIGEMARDNQGYALSCVNYKWSTMYQSVNTNVIGTNNASIIAQANHKKVIVTVASLFLPRDGGHTSYANFTVYKNGSPLSTFQNNINVHKGGSRGHYWGYQSGRTKMMEYSIPVNTGDTISVFTTGSYLLSSSDVRIELF